LDSEKPIEIPGWKEWETGPQFILTWHPGSLKPKAQQGAFNPFSVAVCEVWSPSFLSRCLCVALNTLSTAVEGHRVSVSTNKSAGDGAQIRSPLPGQWISVQVSVVVLWPFVGWLSQVKGKDLAMKKSCQYGRPWPQSWVALGPRTGCRGWRQTLHPNSLFCWLFPYLIILFLGIMYEQMPCWAGWGWI
jgi:hypothetical protein